MSRSLRFPSVLAALALIASGCSDDEKQCEDFCGAGAACVGGACVAYEPCDPACADGQVCQDGACVATLASACGGACAGAGQVCVTSGGEAACVTIPSLVHETYLDKTFASGYAVTAECVGCHAQEAAEVMETLHWTWKGSTPQLHELVDFQVADPLALQNPGTIGKANLINNFCVAVPSNEKRCEQCHAGYGGDPDATKPQVSARAYTAETSSIPLAHRVDCLVCHSDPAAGYAKDLKNFGNPAAGVNLTASAQAIIATPTRKNCGACHFYAGGGDNVKLMGSALAEPTEAVDVHMGRGMDCASCHAEPGHTFKGAGIHVPANTGRSSCEDCHGAAPHAGKFAAGATLDRHTDAIACQTCHIPTFTRSQFGKMDWDWSTAGDKTRGTNGVVTTAVNDAGEPTAGGTPVVTYDYIKGGFVWQRNVKPEYAWYNGAMVHVTVMDKGAFSIETGLTTADADRITLGMPLGGPADAAAKIHPFKLMRGRQAVYVDGASSFVITPNVFGPAGFWGIVQSPGYAYDPDDRTYVAPNAATPVTTPRAFDLLLSDVFTTGARKAGQIASDATLSRFDGTTGWDWRYTKLYMDMNHEVAPKTEALGAGGFDGCADCHSAAPAIDWSALGYACGDPAGCARRP